VEKRLHAKQNFDLGAFDIDFRDRRIAPDDSAYSKEWPDRHLHSLLTC
jgi:hypothetical protein